MLSLQQEADKHKPEITIIISGDFSHCLRSIYIGRKLFHFAAQCASFTFADKSDRKIGNDGNDGSRILLVGVGSDFTGICIGTCWMCSVVNKYGKELYIRLSLL